MSKITTTRYYVDCSKLSAEESKKVEDLLDKVSFFYDVDLNHPRCYVVIWQEKLPPDKLFKLPDGCQVHQI